MTTFDERRGAGTFLALFLTGAFALAAWRGAAEATVLAGVMAVLAVVTLAVWLRWLTQQPRQLEIGPGTIAFGRPGQRSELRAAPGTQLEIRQGYRRSGLFLAVAGDREQASIPLMGFDHREVAAACVTHGWQFRS